MQYLILQHPGHNRVYFNHSENLTIAETTLATNRFSTPVHSIEITVIKGIRYLQIVCENALSEKEISILSKLSFVLAIYINKKQQNEDLLIPIQKVHNEYLNQKISTILKYRGKTNELFTKMMINVALLSSEYSYSDEITLFDPVAGKGTTLFEASVYGFNSYGIELDNIAVQEGATFFKKYLETEKIKHHFNKLKGQDKNLSYLFSFANTKEKFVADNCKTLKIINGNTVEASSLLGKTKFHLIVGDLPYGIHHQNTKKAKNEHSRNPIELVQNALPEWKKVLRKKGIMVLGWNTFLVSRQKMKNAFEQNGFSVLDSETYLQFEHMVDQSIKRDIIVAQVKK